MNPSIASTPPGDLWVFGYGSLMWNPGFEHVERMPALLRGGHRALCILSTHYRGTPEVPGLVLGLVRGGACRGIAFRVAAKKARETHAYLTEREQVTKVYQEQWRRLTLGDGRQVSALTYFADTMHPQYVRLPRDEILSRVRHAHGRAGSCRDYVLSTIAAMAQVGVRDQALEWLSGALSDAASS